MIEYVNYNVNLTSKQDQPDVITTNAEPVELSICNNIVSQLSYVVLQRHLSQNDYVIFIRNIPQLVHTVNHNLGRLPNVLVYTLGGHVIFASTTCTNTTATVSFNTPTACIIVCT